MNITLTLLADGNTSRRELAAVAGELAEALSRSRDVAAVEPVHAAAPEGAKGLADQIGAFMLNLPPAAITGVFDIVRGVLARTPDTPTKIKVSADGGLDLEYDPRRSTPQQIADLVAALRAGAAA